MAKADLTFEDIEGSLAQEKFAPVYLFHGEEDFLIGEATDLVVNAAVGRDQQGFNLDFVYGADADARDIVSHASSFPMMSARRVVVVRDFDKLSNKELLTPYVENPLATTCLILHSAKPDFRRKPYLTISKSGTVVRFDRIRDYQIPGWIEKRTRQQRWEMDSEAVTILSAYVSTSLREIQNELDKLYIYIGKKRVITAEDIRDVVGVSKEYDVFELQNVLGTKDLARATEVLTRMMDAGESPILIIVMLTRYFTALWKLHDLRRRNAPSADVARILGVNPYFVKDYVRALGSYTIYELEHSFEILAATDEQLKSSSVDQVQVMQSMVVRLIQQREVALA